MRGRDGVSSCVPCSWVTPDWPQRPQRAERRRASAGARRSASRHAARRLDSPSSSAPPSSDSLPPDAVYWHGGYLAFLLPPFFFNPPFPFLRSSFLSLYFISTLFLAPSLPGSSSRGCVCFPPPRIFLLPHPATCFAFFFLFPFTSLTLSPPLRLSWHSTPDQLARL